MLSRLVATFAAMCVMSFAQDSGREPAPEANNARMPASDEEMRFWLENMVRYHRFSDDEVATATGLATDEIATILSEFAVRRDDPVTAPLAGEPLRVLPYPGGRHPRIGFLDGAIDPQRETKVSVFLPWNSTSYVVVDVPEAIWSNLGLTYLAHTHIPTVWDQEDAKTKNSPMKPQEWERRPDGSLRMQRELPNGIVFGTLVAPKTDRVEMEMWLTNGSMEKLSDLRVQNCVMLKGAPAFAQQTNENKILRAPFCAVRDEAGKRWIITAWEPNHRSWANPPVPCLHSDPKFPDCEPGKTQKLRGWLSFYEGTDIDAEFERIQRRWLEPEEDEKE